MNQTVDANGGRLRKLPGSVSNGPRRTSHRPISFFRDCRSVLSRKWDRSIVRIALQEIGSCLRRISTIHRNNRLLVGFALPSDPRGCTTANWEEWYTFQRDCTDCIAELLGANPWSGYLDCEMAAEAYGRGARWGLRNVCNETLNAETLRSQTPSADSIRPAVLQFAIDDPQSRLPSRG
jgi:hypothetical protein